MKYIPGWQTFFTIFSHMFTPIPQCSREGDGGFAIFCIYFWKGIKRTWLRHGRVRHAIFSYHLLYPVHSTYYMTISVWWWSLLTIDVPHVDFHSTHWWFPCWWSSMISVLMMIIIDDDLPRCLYVYFNWSPLTINITIPSVIKNIIILNLLFPTQMSLYSIL